MLPQLKHTNNGARVRGAWPTLEGRESKDFPRDEAKKAEICFASGYIAGESQAAQRYRPDLISRGCARKDMKSGMDYTSQKAQRQLGTDTKDSGGAVSSGACSPETRGSEPLLRQRQRIHPIGWVPVACRCSQRWSLRWWRGHGLREKRSADISRIPGLPGAVHQK